MQLAETIVIFKSMEDLSDIGKARLKTMHDYLAVVKLNGNKAELEALLHEFKEGAAELENALANMKMGPANRRWNDYRP